MNNITVIGNLTKDIELRKTDKDISVATFTVAVKREYKNANGEYETDFINCKAFRSTADYLHNYAKKGYLVAVNGGLHTGTYDKQDGTKGYISEVIVEKAKILQKKETEQEIKQDDPLSDFNNEVVLSSDDLPF